MKMLVIDQVRGPATLEEMHERMVEWGRDRHYPMFDVPLPTSALQRMVEDGRDDRIKRRGKQDRRTAKIRDALGIARLRGKKRGALPCKESTGVRMEIVTVDGQSVACPPDGGAGAMIERMASSIERANNTREINRVLPDMPEDMLTFVRCTYVAGHPGDVPKEWDVASAAMGCSKSAYYRRREKALTWLAEALSIPLEKAA